MADESIIAAIATPAGQGAIAVIRVSGHGSISLTEQLFRPRYSQKTLSESKTWSILYGEIHSGNEVIDDVLVSIFKAPRSYTGEELVEISCHGSVIIQKSILNLLLRQGARLAKPGEFTLRAFLNGKMDLSQAEAVADLISSSSEASRKVALQQMRGGFSLQIEMLRERLLNFISLVELELDFSEEDVEFADRTQLKLLVEEIVESLGKTARSFELGNAIKNGIPVAIIGKPNVGKSTLLNVLLNEEKAIVSEIPGTTRDSIEDTIHVGDLLFRFIDTAGIRQTNEVIESIGIERTYEQVRKASIVLYMADASESPDELLKGLGELAQGTDIDGKVLILVLNKLDLLKCKPETQIIKKKLSGLHSADFDVIGISAREKEGIDTLLQILLQSGNFKNISAEDVIITNARHFEALDKSHQAAKRILEGLDSNLPGDLLAMDMREVLNYFGEITGHVTTDEILGNIFRNFCIGK
jgi:tRNA modification GTPase